MLTEISYGGNGIFVIIEYDPETKQIKQSQREKSLCPGDLEPMGDAHLIQGNGRTIPEIVQETYKSILNNDPEIYEKINNYSISNLPPDYSRDKPINGIIVITFRHSFRDKSPHQQL